MFYILVVIFLLISVTTNVFFLENFTIDKSIDSKNIVFLSHITSLFFFTLSIYFLIFLRKKKFLKLIKKKFNNFLLIFFSILFSLIAVELILNKFSFKVLQNYTIKNYEFVAKYTYNFQGFRDESFKKNEEKILFVGDSFVFGSAVDNPFTIDKLVEEKISKRTNKKMNIFNLGMPGADLNDYLRNLEQFISKNTEKIFIFIYIDNDIFPGFGDVVQKKRVRLNSLKKKIIRFIDELKFLNLLSDYFINDIYSKSDFYKDFNLSKKYEKIFKSNLANPHILSLKYRGNFSDHYSNMSQWFNDSRKNNILEIVNLSKKNNADLYFVLIPSKFQVKIHYHKLPEKEFGYIFNENEIVNNEIQITMTEWFLKNNLNVIDLLPILQKSDKLNYYLIDDHFNKEGNNLVSSEIIKYIN